MSNQEYFEKLNEQVNNPAAPALSSALPILIEVLKISDELTPCGNRRERMRQKLSVLSAEERVAVKRLLLSFSRK